MRKLKKLLNRVCAKWHEIAQDFKILMNMDMRVFDDPGTLIGGELRSETIQMVKEARERAGVSSEESEEVE